MFKFAQLLAAGSALIALSACTYDNAHFDANESAKADRTFARGPDPANARRDEFEGEMAAQSGDWKLTLAFSERSYQQTPDLNNEFNLATAYEHTGNNALAIPLYIDLVDRGEYTLTHSMLNADGTMPHPMLRTISMESARRLGRLGGSDAGIGPVVARKGADQGFGNN
jgi:hypothetical protein